MHPLHDYFAKQLAGKLSKRGVVVWYDPRSERAPFGDELRGGPRRPRTFMAAVLGSPKKIGSTCSMMSALTSSAAIAPTLIDVSTPGLT